MHTDTQENNYVHFSVHFPDIRSLALSCTTLLDYGWSSAPKKDSLSRYVRALQVTRP